MKTSNYIYGSAANNMHGNLSDAVEAKVITQNQANAYENTASRVMLGKHVKSGFLNIDKIQFTLDKFFKKEDLNYSDFEKMCIEHSGDKDVTVCCPDHFRRGWSCYYTPEGKTVNIDFISRFAR